MYRVLTLPSYLFKLALNVILQSISRSSSGLFWRISNQDHGSIYILSNEGDSNRYTLHYGRRCVEFCCFETRTDTPDNPEVPVLMGWNYKGYMAKWKLRSFALELPWCFEEECPNLVLTCCSDCISDYTNSYKPRGKWKVFLHYLLYGARVLYTVQTYYIIGELCMHLQRLSVYWKQVITSTPRCQRNGSGWTRSSRGGPSP